MAPKAKDITGERFGKLTAIKFIKKTKQYEHLWEFKCNCGNVIWARKKAITNPNSKAKSCGCLKYKKYLCDII